MVCQAFGNFTYYQDWAGFNVPSTAFQQFYEGKFNPLEKEKQLLRLFKDVRERFYVIGIYDSGAKDSLTHELAHALFFVDDSYRKARGRLRKACHSRRDTGLYSRTFRQAGSRTPS